ncbi:hypothetical protein THC_0494 [Caldimicrobium thiodismutans]|uniref:ArsR family transcriptional regulator n=1 Tax=Caldimicrobium thiodismutans TaxID=1653476 RepID=A0A0U5AUF9_9BACT|nr:hypothetical protein [Caldimicrobium thiodismutans]BAU22888.1 hypothetical protein THC_0494 [Caldimicrobium thiodismutans]
MERYEFFLKFLDEKDRIYLKELFYFEPDCAEFISRRLNIDLKEIKGRLKFLENLGIIKRVFIKENYIYFEIRPEWRAFLRKYYMEGRDDESRG